ncbi:MAG: nucleoside-diphosphate sugar epimerase/dehydratase [Lachnospiraceae bacterium]|nr:nucleoside-diphosphate sugar epimerase/dehydratase [Lachnospiraceae bacterium]
MSINDSEKINNQISTDKDSKTSYGITKRANVRWLLVVYDVIIYVIAVLLLIGLHLSSLDAISFKGLIIQMVLGFICIFGMRFVFDVYRQIWRYGGMRAYLRLLLADICGGVLYLILEILLPIEHILFVSLLSIVCLSLLGAMAIRIIYYFVYRAGTHRTKGGKIIRGVLRILGGLKINPDKPSETAIEARKINVAIIGAGRVGVNLAEELQNNLRAPYKPVCFVDVDTEKIGRTIYGIPVFSEDDVTQDIFDDLNVQEVIFAFPEKSIDEQKELYAFYKKAGFKIKVYDYPSLQTANVGKRQLREFDTEELLFRNEIEFNDEKTASYYKDRKVLVTGGGGSIGSEMVRQIARMNPSEIIILDIYENGAYDLQQELRITYGDTLDVHVEITSIDDEQGMERVFKKYRPDVIIHAAAHKHVPLMENNVCEAIQNNVFGTWVTVKMAEKYNAKKFIMVSTDKAVNPTNVMGATKRMCEMIVISCARSMKKINFNCTRFGNVLGSAGSVIPLFKKQIANGGPVTITDKRIVRYFMTIPEASNLVLQAGAMAKNGELSVLDMGRPVKILELAENMISLSGYEPYKDIDIIETGLRPGEKLYEELLIKSETLSKTDNDRIFVEKDTPLTKAELEEKMEILRRAVEYGNDDQAKIALHKVVPTYKTPEEVNKTV